MGAPIKIDEAWLREQYIDLQRSAKNISEEIGCSAMGVMAALDRAGIPRRGNLEARRATPPHKRGRVVMPEAAELYAAGMTLKDLAKRYDVSHATARTVLADAGVDIRGQSEAMKLGWSDPAVAERRRASIRANRSRPTGIREMKRLLIQDAVCAVCGDGDHIEQHHLNGVRSDHRPENIAPLCHSCHVKVEWFIRHATEGLRAAYNGKKPDLRLAT